MKKIKTIAAIAAAALMLSSCGPSVPIEKLNLLKSNFSLANDRYVKLADKVASSDDERLKELYAQWGGAIAEYNKTITTELDDLSEVEVDIVSEGVSKLLDALEDKTQEFKTADEVSVTDPAPQGESENQENPDYNLDFKLINSTGVDIYEIYISENNQNNWTSNLIPSQKMLPAGNEIGIAFKAGESEKLWDIKAVDKDENVVLFSGIDLSLSSYVTLTIDENKNPIAKLR